MVKTLEMLLICIWIRSFCVSDCNRGSAGMYISASLDCLVDEGSRWILFLGCSRWSLFDFLGFGSALAGWWLDCRLACRSTHLFTLQLKQDEITEEEEEEEAGEEVGLSHSLFKADISLYKTHLHWMFVSAWSSRLLQRMRNQNLWWVDQLTRR